MVEGGELADDRDDGVGVAEVVGRRRRRGARSRARRHSRDSRRDPRAAAGALRGTASGSRSRSDSTHGEDAVVDRAPQPGASPCMTSTWRPRATSVAAGERPTKEKRLQRSPCSTDSRRKPRPIADHGAERADGRQGVGDELTPDRHDRVVAGKPTETLEIGSDLGASRRGGGWTRTRTLPGVGADHVGNSPNRRWKQVHSPV